MSKTIELQNKTLVLRLNRLGHLPPAVAATQMLSESGVDILVCEFGNSTAALDPSPDLFSTWKVPLKGASLLPRKLLGLAAVFYALAVIGIKIYRQRPKIMIAHGIQEQWLARMLNIIFKVPYVVHVHEAYESRELTPTNRFFFAFEGTALRHAEFLIFPEADRAKIYVKRYKIKRPIYLTYNCPRLRNPTMHHPLRPTLGISREKKLLLYLGGIGPTNTLMELLEALKELPQVVLLLAGWGDQNYIEQLKNRITALGLGKNVFFLGSVSPEDKWKYLDQADATYCVYRPLYLRLRHAATASNKLMESLAAGVPVLTSDQPDFRTLVESRDVGVCVDFSPPAIKQGLELLLFDELSQSRRKKNALESHRSVFNFERQFQGPLTAFKEILNIFPVPVRRIVN